MPENGREAFVSIHFDTAIRYYECGVHRLLENISGWRQIQTTWILQTALTVVLNKAKPLIQALSEQFGLIDLEFCALSGVWEKD
jgi:hypothetical protein